MNNSVYHVGNTTGYNPMHLPVNRLEEEHCAVFTYGFHADIRFAGQQVLRLHTLLFRQHLDALTYEAIGKECGMDRSNGLS